MPSIDKVISDLKEKRIFVNKVLSRTELIRRLKESILISKNPIRKL